MRKRIDEIVLKSIVLICLLILPVRLDRICVDFPHSHHAMWSDPDKTEEFRKAVLSYCDTYMP